MPTMSRLPGETSGGLASKVGHMEGQFRIDLTYERILGEADTEVEVPTIAVAGAEVERGRLAVEALSVVEVQPSVTEQLSSLDINELSEDANRRRISAHSGSERRLQLRRLGIGVLPDRRTPPADAYS